MAKRIIFPNGDQSIRVAICGNGTVTWYRHDEGSYVAYPDPTQADWHRLAVRLSLHMGELEQQAADTLAEVQGYADVNAAKPLAIAIQHLAEVADAVKCDNCGEWWQLDDLHKADTDHRYCTPCLDAVR
jgi:formylmethanofuran dehydrogenase subunit E